MADNDARAAAARGAGAGAGAGRPGARAAAAAAAGDAGAGAGAGLQGPVGAENRRARRENDITHQFWAMVPNTNHSASSSKAKSQMTVPPKNWSKDNYHANVANVALVEAYNAVISLGETYEAMTSMGASKINMKAVGKQYNDLLQKVAYLERKVTLVGGQPVAFPPERLKALPEHFQEAWREKKVL